MSFEKFDVKCKKCGSADIKVEDRSERWDDGDGYIDVNEYFVLVCNRCGEEED